MAMVICQNGESDSLKFLLNNAAPQDLVLRLFTNNVTPAQTDTAGMYTEASGFGYAAITLTGSGWTIVEGATAMATYALQSFIFTGALGNVVGYYLTRASSGRLFGAEKFSDGPYLIRISGDHIDINPAIDQGSQ